MSIDTGNTQGQKASDKDKKKKKIVLFFVFLFMLIFDQVSKSGAEFLLKPGESIPLLKNIFHMSLVHNTGIAFGFLKSIPLFGWVFVYFIFIAAILWYGGGIQKRNLSSLFCAGCIAVGAIGNLIDRVRFGFVVDFLDFRVWPVFNFADAYITIGAGLLLVTMVQKRKQQNAITNHQDTITK